MELELNKIYNGEALEVLKTFPNESIDCVVTSPPYWALRDYGVEGQLGLEPTFQEYISRLCDIFDEVKRVLKKEGTCWVNIGDTYNSHGEVGRQDKHKYGGISKVEHLHGGGVKDYPAKCLCQIPSRFAIEMCNRGWILRNEIIWYKRNCMPSSVTDRFTVDFEKIFFFTKSKKYWFEQQLEESIWASKDKRSQIKGGVEHKSGKSLKKQYSSNRVSYTEGGMKNKRTVWDITTKGFSGAHFAVFPEKLIETPIKAGCPLEICNKCGKAREKIIEKEGLSSAELSKGMDKTIFQSEQGQKQNLRCSTEAFNRKIIDKGYTNCGCDSGFHKGIVLDPFMGSGTTAKVALEHNRSYVGIELNTEYIEIINKRLEGIPTKSLLDF